MSKNAIVKVKDRIVRIDLDTYPSPHILITFQNRKKPLHLLELPNHHIHRPLLLAPTSKSLNSPAAQLRSLLPATHLPQLAACKKGEGLVDAQTRLQAKGNLGEGGVALAFDGDGGDGQVFVVVGGGVVDEGEGEGGAVGGEGQGEGQVFFEFLGGGGARAWPTKVKD